MVDETITAANTINDRPVVVEFIIRTDAMVWPMVAFGASNDEITIARDMAPDWGCLLYTSPSPRDRQKSRMPSSA